MGMTLRPYQEEAKAAVLDEWSKGRNRTLLVLPTGTGKTIVFASIIENQVRKGQRVLILAHRGELLDQAADKLLQATGLGCSVEKAEQTCEGQYYRVTVGSVQSMMRPARLNRFPDDFFGSIVVDEAHHCVSDSYQAVLSHFPGAKVLGVTATPDRADMKDLGTYFESLAYSYDLPRAIREGYLCPIRAMTIPLEIDITGVGVSAGDFKVGELGSALDPYLDQIATEMETHCKGRKTVVFLPLVATSKKFCSILRDHGFRAAEVNGNSEDRAEVLADFDAGEYDVLCNSMLLTEGWDCPSVDCIIVLRATKSRALYAQMVGRGTRLSPDTGKKDLLLLDFLWMTTRLDLCHPAALICKDPEVAQRMTKDMEAATGPTDIEEAEKKASEEVQQEREEALAAELARQRRKKARLVDPLQYAMSIDANDLVDYVPAFGWEAAPPSDKQIEKLEAAGINPADVGTAGEASLLLGHVMTRRQLGMATPKQIRQLEGRGFKDVGTWTFDQANRLISRIASNGWRTPLGIDPTAYRPAAGE